MKNKNNSSIQRWMLFFILAASLAFNGCATTAAVHKDKLNVGTVDTANPDTLPKTVYAVTFRKLDMVIGVKKFGVARQNNNEQDDDMVNVSHGLSYLVDLNTLSMTIETELEMILKRKGFKSLKEFKKSWDKWSPVIPNSDFKPVTTALGIKLFDFAIENNQDRHEEFQSP